MHRFCLALTLPCCLLAADGAATSVVSPNGLVSLRFSLPGGKPTYSVSYRGRPNMFDVDAARAMLQEIETSQAAIREKGKFSAPEASAKLLALYEDGAKDLRARINQRAK